MEILLFSSFTHSSLLWPYDTSSVGTFTGAKQGKKRVESQVQSLNASSRKWHTSFPLYFIGQSKSHDHTWLQRTWKYNPPVGLEAAEKQMLVMPTTSRRTDELVLREGRNVSPSFSLLPVSLTAAHPCCRSRAPPHLLLLPASVLPLLFPLLHPEDACHS